MADMAEVKSILETQGRAFDEYKKVNDERLKNLAEGKSVSDLEAKLAKMDEAMNAAQSALDDLGKKMSRPGVLAGSDGQRTTPEAEAYKSAFLSWVRNPKDVKRESALQQRAKALQAVEAKAFGDDELETRATSTLVGTNSAGGYALPKVIESAIARLSVDISPIRSISTVRQVSTTDYHELFDINGAAFEWLGEGDTRNQTNTPDLAEVVPTFGMASAKPQASEESLDDLFFDVEAWLAMSVAEAMAQGEGVSFITGNGTKKPTGFLGGPAPVATADSSRAFGTLQYIPSGGAAALPTSVDTFIDLVYSLRARYRANARWVMAKLSVASLRKYKDSTNQYLWQPSTQAGTPSQFLGYPVVEAEDMPAVAANAFPIAFGDFREGYLIVDRVGMRMTRDEITTPGYVKFYTRKRLGGKLRNTQAIKLLKCAIS